MADEAAAKDPSATASASSEHMFDAVAAGNLVEVERLLQTNPGALAARGAMGQTPAHLAAFFGKQVMLHFIARHSPEMLFEQTPHGETPGHSAAAQGHTECILFLATHSLSHVFARDADGWTLAHSASCYGRFETLVALARAAPSLFGIRTHAGMLPSQVAPSRAAVLLVEHLEGTCTSPPGAKPGLDSAALLRLWQQLHGRDRPASPSTPESPDSRATAAGGEPAGGFPAGQRAEDGAAGGSGEEARHSRGADGEDQAGAAQQHPAGWQQDVTSTEQQSSWKALLGGLRKNSDITSMLIPAEFIRPESSLERLQDTMQHGRLLEDVVASPSSAVDRMKAVVRFHLSGVIRAIFDGKKPYNPVLGETCAWTFEHGADGAGAPSHMVCEQVSHHPPVSAFYLWNRALGVSLEGFAETCPRFTGNSVVVPFKGERRLRIPRLGETYVLTVANLVYRGLLFGARGAEWTGTVTVACEKTGLRCKLELKPLGTLGLWGSWHRVEGAIKVKGRAGNKVLVGSIAGHWDKVVYYTDARGAGNGSKEAQGDAGREVLYDFEAAAATRRLRLVQPPRAVLPSDSQVVWAALSEALTAREMKRANRVKGEIEQAQRDLAARRSKGGEAWEPRFFARGRVGEPAWAPRVESLLAFAKTHMVD